MKTLALFVLLVPALAFVQKDLSLPICGYGVYPCINTQGGQPILYGPQQTNQSDDPKIQSERAQWIAMHPNAVMVPGSAQIHAELAAAQAKQQAASLLIQLFNGPEGHAWLNAYTWARANGCHPRHYGIFHRKLNQQAEEEYRDKVKLLASDKSQKVAFLCGW